MEPKIGATGDYPNGKLNKDDEGGLLFRMTNDQGNIIIDFGKQVHWIAMPPKEARELIAGIEIQISKIENSKS